MATQCAIGSGVDFDGVGLIIANLGNFGLVSSSLRWFWMVLNGFQLVVGGFRWLQVVSDEFGWFAVLLVTREKYGVFKSYLPK